ncbi:DNA-directed DNA polymerase [Tanacetum coccineum]
MAEYSQKWHNGISSRTRSTETSDGLDAIQVQLNNLGREIKKVNEKVYAAQVGCEICKGPHYTKDCPQKEEGKTLEEAYYTQFGAPYQPGGQYRAAGPGFYQRNNGNSSYPDQRQSLEESLTKFMEESAKRHEENSNIIKEIRASTDAAIRNQGASIKTLEIQIGQMSKVLQEKEFGSLPSSTETNPRRPRSKSILTAKADFSGITTYRMFTIIDDDDKTKDVVLDTVMSDSEDSTVTYTEVSSPFTDLSDIGSPRVDGPLVMPEDPYAYVVAAFQAPPSPDYVPGPKEPEQAPPLPDFFPEPVYPEFMPTEDKVLPAEEQPLPVVLSPTVDSSGYVPESDPEEDLEEDDDEDPKGDLADYPADGGDDGDDED